MKSLPHLSQLDYIVLDFDGVFTDNTVLTDTTGTESVVCDRADGLGLSILRKYITLNRLKLDVFVLSTETNAVVAARCKKLNLQYTQSISDKHEFLNAFFSSNPAGLTAAWKRTLYIGNDLNDLKCIQRAGHSICPGDAHTIIKKYSHHVFPASGGHGFLRSVVESLIRIDDLPLSDLLKLL